MKLKVLVIGRGTVGSALAEFQGVTAISHKSLGPDSLDDFDILVNCAGIGGYGRCKAAGHSEVMTANVQLALDLQNYCLSRGVPFVQLSTMGVYAKQVKPLLVYSMDGKPDFITEDCRVYPHNLYCSSKIIAEQLLAEKIVDGRGTYILRMGWLVGTDSFRQRARQFGSVQNTYCGITYPETLIKVLHNIVRKSEDSFFKVGIYNLQSKTVWFPLYVKEILGYGLPCRDDYPKDMTSAVPLDTTKIVEVGFLS